MFDPQELEMKSKTETAKYKMVANFVHEGSYETGEYKIQIRKEEWKEWFEVSGGLVREISEDKVKRSETIIQVYLRLD